MDLLPGQHEQKALLDGLAAIIEARGFETFVSAPLLEPHPRFFPDPWEPSARGVRALAIRLLHYADGGHLDAKVTLYQTSLGQEVHEGAVAWFAGIHDNACLFGVDTSQLREHDAVVGTLCHEVAHAYRAFTRLAEAHDRLEEENTDLTTIYLGFGLLTTNNAYRFRKRVVGAGYSLSAAWTGYLSPQAMAFALAAQVVARGLSAAETKRIAGLLETNQQAFFREACKTLAQDVDALRIRLGLPPVEVWPGPRPVQLEPLPEDVRFDPGDGVGEVVLEEYRPPQNRGRPVFRVRERGTARYFNGGLALGTLAGGLSSPWLHASTVLCALIGGVLGGLLFSLVGRTRVTDECSGPECAASIPRSASECPRCNGHIRGVIRDRNERLAAEEALDSDAS
jgi:hypothetical protein